MGSKASRVALFDNVKAVLIVLVIMGHLFGVIAPLSNSHAVVTAEVWIYSFHMPAFVFVSGLFANRVAADPAKKRSYRAEKPLSFFVLYLLFYSAVYLYNLFIGKDVTFNPFLPLNISWYLLLMALYLLLVPFLQRVRAQVMLPICVVLGLTAGLYVKDVNLLAMGRFLTYLPMFAAGYYLTSDRVLRIRERLVPLSTRGRVISVVAALLLLAWFVALYLMPESIPYTLRKVATGINTFSSLAKKAGFSVSTVLLFRVGAYLNFALMTFLLFLATPLKRTFFTYVGERSLQVYILHAFVYRVIAYYGWDSDMLQISALWALSPFVTAPLLGLVLAAPRFPEKVLRAVEGSCKRLLSNTFTE